MTHSFWVDIIIMFFSCIGFVLAFHIYHRKRSNQPLVCPLHAKCELVTHSDYSKFFKIPVEILGMIYYAFVILLHGFIFAYPNTFSLLSVKISLITSAIALIFSFYLVMIQAFVLKQWCTWCLCSATLCIAIFIVTYINAQVSILLF